MLSGSSTSSSSSSSSSAAPRELTTRFEPGAMKSGRMWSVPGGICFMSAGIPDLLKSTASEASLARRMQSGSWVPEGLTSALILCLFEIIPRRSKEL